MFLGYILDQINGSFPPGPPPSPVRIGRMLIVSSLGNDATGTRQDVVFHFLTLDAALAAAIDGDTIVMYPGDYVTASVDGLAVADFLTIFCFPGVTITGTIFNGTKEGFKLLGYPDLLCEGDQQLSSPGIVSTTVIKANTIIVDGGLRWWFGGSHNIEVLNDILIGEDSDQGLVFLNLSSTAHNFTLRARDIIYANNNGGVYCMPFINIETDSVFDIRCRRIIATGENTPAVLFFNQVDKGRTTDYRAEIHAEIWHLGIAGKYCIRCNANNEWVEGSQYGIYVKGLLYCASNASAINLIAGKLRYEGDIRVEDPTNVCVLTAYPAVINSPSTLYLYNGTCYNRNNTDIVSYTEQIDNMVQFKNYKVIAPGGYLVNSPGEGSLYQVLDCYSNIDVNTAFVTNQIAPTTLIVDPLII